MEVFLIRVLQFILAISLLVLLHEGGHFFFAKLFGVRVDKFYIFFDWKFSLFKFKPKNSDTEYGIGWLPLGGYCKIAGMIDESFDTEQMKQPVQNYEFRAKPAWQRLLIMIGGVLVNFLLALFIYSQILFWWGDTYIPVKDMTLGMKFNQEAKSYGFKDGDVGVAPPEQNLTIDEQGQQEVDQHTANHDEQALPGGLCTELILLDGLFHLLGIETLVNHTCYLAVATQGQPSDAILRVAVLGFEFEQAELPVEENVEFIDPHSE